MNIKLYSIFFHKEKRLAINNHIFINILNAKQVSKKWKNYIISFNQSFLAISDIDNRISNI